MAIKRRKLYFDVNLDSPTDIAFPCTQITAGTPGDRHGALLPHMEPLTAGAPAALRTKAAVRARFMCADASSLSGFSDGWQAIGVDFITATQNITSPAGVADPVGLRDFRVRLRRDTGGDIRGVLVVERQHTIEV